jgi:hypothetical protein
MTGHAEGQDDGGVHVGLPHRARAGADQAGQGCLFTAAVHGALQAAQPLKHPHPAGGEHPGCRLHDRVQDAGDLAAGLHDGTGGESEVCLS